MCGLEHSRLDLRLFSLLIIVIHYPPTCMASSPDFGKSTLSHVDVGQQLLHAHWWRYRAVEGPVWHLSAGIFLLFILIKGEEQE